MKERDEKMKNILSYKEDSIFTGQEIIDFCQNQIEVRGSHFKEAKRIYLHYNFKPNSFYQLKYLSFGPGTDSCRYYTNIKIAFIRL